MCGDVATVVALPCSVTLIGILPGCSSVENRCPIDGRASARSG